MNINKHLFKHILLIAAAGCVLQACSTIDGDYQENSRPLVNFVNNEPDADEAEANFHIDAFNFAFPDSLTGFSEAVTGGFPEPGTEAITGIKYQLINYQYFQIQSLDSLIEVHEDGSHTVVDPALYELDPNIGRYLWLTQPEIGAAFHWQLNQNYSLSGDFIYQPVYSFSPMIFWAGSDPDGFVEQYRYYDHLYTDDADLQTLLTNLAADPNMDLDWTYTQNTQAVINLRTSLGQIQKHALLVQSVDNDGSFSDAAVRIFNRSNRAPNTPRITYQKDGFNSVGQPVEYKRRVLEWSDFIGDAAIANGMQNQTPYASIPSYYRTVQNWNGVRFLVSGDDPDDQAFVTIPLQFRYELIKFDENSDSLSAFRDYNDLASADASYDDNGLWVADYGTVISLGEDNTIDYEEAYAFDSEGWSDNSILELYNLESGWYQIMVWTRDDGLEASVTPSWVRFKVKSMERVPPREILLLNYTPTNLAPATLRNALGGRDHDEHAAWYRELIQDTYVQGLQRDAITWNTDVTDDSYTSRYWELGDPDYPTFVPFEVISDYKVVICLDDGYKGSSTRSAAIVDNFRIIAMDYLDLGGNLLWTGQSSLIKSFGFNGDDINNTMEQMTTNGGDFLSGYMGIIDVYADLFLTFQNSRGDGMTAAIPEFTFLDTLRLNVSVIDTMRDDGNTFFDGRYDDPENPGEDARSPLPGNSLPYVGAVSLNEFSGTQAVYTYNSFTANLDRDRTFDFFEVIDAADPSFEVLFAPEEVGGFGFNFAPSPDANGCWIWIPNTERNMQDITIFSTSEAHNISREDNMWAQPIEDVKIVMNTRDIVVMYLQHQAISDPADYWQVGDTVSVSLRWDPILPKHRKVTTCFTDNLNMLGGFGPFGGFPTYTNFRTAFNSVPLYLIEEGEFGPFDPVTGLVPGTGHKGLMQNLMFSFLYNPKIQDLIGN